MSEELAQEDEDAEDYDMEALERRTRLRDGDDDDDATLVGGRRGHSPIVGDDAVVFEIGDHEDDEDESKSPDKPRHKESGEHDGAAHEREGLMGGDRERQD